MLGKDFYLKEDKYNIANGIDYKKKVTVIGFGTYLRQESCYIQYYSKRGEIIDNGLVFKSNLKEVE